jgi:hypothetical protein
VRLLGDFRLDFDLVRLDFDLVRLDLDLVRLLERDLDLVRDFRLDLDLDLVRFLGDLALLERDLDLVRFLGDLALLERDFDLVRFLGDFRLDFDLDLERFLGDFRLERDLELEPLPVCETVLLNVLESSSELSVVSNCLLIDARISVDSGSLILIIESSGNFRKPSVSNKLGQLSSGLLITIYYYNKEKK